MSASGPSDQSWRINADPDNVARSLAGLVLAILELLRELLERQAIRRVDSGTLTPSQVEKLGLTLMELKDRLAKLREAFGITEADLGLPPSVVKELREAAELRIDEGFRTDGQLGTDREIHPNNEFRTGNQKG
jgi:Gas vesicle protein K